MSEATKHQPFSYVILKQVLAPYAIIVQVSFDTQTPLFSNRLALSQALNVEALVEEYIGERTDWFKKRPTTYKKLAEYILQTESGNISEFTMSKYQEISNEIKASDSLLQIRALYYLNEKYSDKLDDESFNSPDILEESLIHAYNVDEYIRTIHYYLSQIDHQSKVNNSDGFNFKFS